MKNHGFFVGFLLICCLILTGCNSNNAFNPTPEPSPTSEPKVSRFEDNGKYGLKLGDQIIADAIWDTIYNAGDDLYKVEISNRWGVMNEKGEVIIEPAYQHIDTISYSNNKCYIVEQNDLYGIINQSGDYLIQPKWKYCHSVGDYLEVVRESYSEGYEIVELGTWKTVAVLPNHIERIIEKRYAVYCSDRNSGPDYYYMSSGNDIHKIHNDEETLSVYDLEKNRLLFQFDCRNKSHLDSDRYSFPYEITYTSYGFFIKSVSNSYDVLSLNTKNIVPIYEWQSYHGERFYRSCPCYYMFSLNGEKLLNCNMISNSLDDPDSVYIVRDTNVIVENQKSFGVASHLYNMANKCMKMVSCYNFKSENVSSINGKEYYAGQVTSDFAQKNNISDDYFIVDLTDAKVSYLHEIDAIGTISDGLLAVQNKNGKWGYVDLSGKIVIEFQFEEAHDFSNGKADVIYKYKKQMIDTKGNIL